MSYGSWAIVVAAEHNSSIETRMTMVMKVPGVVEGRDGCPPIFHGTLEEFAKHWRAEFRVYPNGAYIKV